MTKAGIKDPTSDAPCTKLTNTNSQYSRQNASPIDAIVITQNDMYITFLRPYLKKKTETCTPFQECVGQLRIEASVHVIS